MEHESHVLLDTQVKTLRKLEIEESYVRANKYTHELSKTSLHVAKNKTNKQQQHTHTHTNKNEGQCKITCKDIFGTNALNSTTDLVKV